MQAQSEVPIDWDHVVAFATAELPAYLLRQRWYPAKDAPAPVVMLAHLVSLAVPGLAAALAIWIAEPPGRPAMRLFLPLAIFPDGQLPSSDPALIGQLPAMHGWLGDAVASDAFVRACVRCMLEPDPAIPTGLEAGRTAQIGLAGLDIERAAEWRIRRSSVEQSNTSIRIGEAAILKIIRKLEQGVHPELEMGRFLTEHTHFDAMPALLGWIDVQGATLGILQAFIANEGDGWRWILDRLQGPAAQHALALRWVRKLGERTAQMHLALADTTGDADFDPVPAAAADWQRWAHEIEGMARRVVDALERAELEPPARASAAAFAERSAELPRLLAELLPTAPVAKTRHHGDYHLGQVLVRGDDVAIVDFEGEPLRPLAERRAKHVPLRDVAGMLRSFGYAAAVAERQAEPAAATALAALRRWPAAASEAFLSSYCAALDEARATPGDAPQAARLVRFFTIEKALYEVLYELANRPSWVSIPLGSVLASMAAASDEPHDPRAVRARAHALPHGAELQAGGGVRFRFWAPGCEHVHLEMAARKDDSVQLLTMSAVGEGWHELTVAGGAGTRYRYVLPDGMRVPDPASRFQPDDVHGASEVIDPAAYAWHDGAWVGRPWHEAVIYELHVGAFTAAGTFRAAIERLDHLAALGVTAIEIMPVADFPGARNWGYDGVMLYAPDSSYGRPEDLKALVDAAHARGLMVLLDVVYNHFGPDGNYLPVYAPAFFTDRHKTPWGAAINYDGPHSRPVREFVIHNALYWLQEYHFDGLRLDAVHAIIDDSRQHVLDELAERARAAGPAHLLLENEENQARRLLRAADGTPRHYTAQWNDDVHHVLHAAVTGEDQGYYADYVGAAQKLARALAEGFAFQGEMMPFRGSPRGEPSALLPPTAFVAFLQNHDQIGNRAFGERLTALAPAAAVRAAAAVYLLLPQVPMLFMGEEWGAAQPFAFFCDFSGELAAAVREGRRAEFAKFPEFQDETLRERIPDPQAASTFLAAKLGWTQIDEPEHAAWHDWYRRLLAVRRETIVPLLPSIGGNAARYDVIGPGALAVSWRSRESGTLTLAANLSAAPVSGFPAAAGRILWQEGHAAAEGVGGPWLVRWSLA